MIGSIDEIVRQDNRAHMEEGRQNDRETMKQSGNIKRRKNINDRIHTENNRAK